MFANGSMHELRIICCITLAQQALPGVWHSAGAGVQPRAVQASARATCRHQREQCVGMNASNVQASSQTMCGHQRKQCAGTSASDVQAPMQAMCRYECKQCAGIKYEQYAGIKCERRSPRPPQADTCNTPAHLVSACTVTVHTVSVCLVSAQQPKCRTSHGPRTGAALAFDCAAHLRTPPSASLYRAFVHAHFPALNQKDKALPRPQPRTCWTPLTRHSP